MPAALDLPPDRIVAAARGLIAADGLAAFSMRRLASDLGVNPMTIYLRFENKDALLAAVAEDALRGLELPPAVGPWHQQVVELAVALRDHLVADRETLRILGDASRLRMSVLDGIERGLELMLTAGFEADEAVAAFRQVFWHAVGAALVVSAFDDLPATTTDLVATLAAAPDHPHVARHAEHFGPVDRDDLFRATTQTLVAGLQPRAGQEEHA